MAVDRGIVAGCVCPHPPLLVPDIGGRELAKVADSVAAMRELADIVGSLSPDVLVVISPHSPLLSSSFAIKDADKLRGDFAQFGCRVGLERPNDLELAKAIIRGSAERGVSVTPLPSGTSVALRKRGELDHGVLVPLYYLGERSQAPLVSLSLSMLPYESHFALGELVADCCEELGRRAVFVASGDLSHRLIPGAPAGFSPRGKDFDAMIAEIVETGDFQRLIAIDEDLVEEAGECGFRSIHTMWGALHRYELSNRLLSYEGPFGVGYLVSFHRPV